jgi:lipopolysaccharide/colanic/teichoic acid biosynthesis glycosyltransferase
MWYVSCVFQLRAKLTDWLLAVFADNGFRLRVMARELIQVDSDCQLRYLDSWGLVNMHAYSTQRADSMLLKRTFDLLVATSLLIVLAPLLLLIGLMVKLGSRGPAIFRQERVGLNGKRFWIYKFRTMKMVSRQVSDTRWTEAPDEPVSLMDQFLRRTGLDELPQLINVVKGDMSMVGPRPERPHFVDIFRREVPKYMARHYIKCGITGWAQVNGWRGNTSIRRRIEHDLYYMQHWTFWFDVKILLLTFARGFYQRNPQPLGNRSQII